MKSFDLGLHSVILVTVITITLLGLVMVASSSMALAVEQTGQPFYYLIRQSIFLVIGCAVIFIVANIPLSVWFNMGPWLLVVCIAALIVVLIPGVGSTVNGSTRWLSLGPLNIQVSEMAKLCMVIYLSGYMVRHQHTIQTKLVGFIKPLMIMMLVSSLLLLQPDFGAVVVLFAMGLGLLFFAGVPKRSFLVIFLLAGSALLALAVSSPYRWNRIVAFLDPWADQFNSGYQLTQALIAFGRGQWFGVGLGSSVQKLFYLPEAHTDFLFAVMGEELGLIGIFLVVTLFAILIGSGLSLARKAYHQNRFFSAYLAFGISLWLGVQAFISMGVNTGLLPTKGLTLPLMSYGGSSLVITLFAIGLLLRIAYECKPSKVC